METIHTKPSTTLSRLVARGELTRVLPGIYLSPAELEDVPTRCHAVQLWDRDAVIFGHAAAKLTFWPELRVDEIAVGSRRNPTGYKYRFSEARFPPEAVLPLTYFTLTTPPVTALELAVETEGASLDTILRSRMCTVRHLNDAMGLLKGRPGNIRRRRLLFESRHAAWSAPERRAHALLTKHRIVGWTANFEVKAAGARYFVDIAFPSQRLAIEIDGFEYHHTQAAFTSDRIRHNALTLAGWTVLRFSAVTVMDDPELFVETVLAAMRGKNRV